MDIETRRRSLCATCRNHLLQWSEGTALRLLHADLCARMLVASDRRDLGLILQQSRGHNMSKQPLRNFLILAALLGGLLAASTTSVVAADKIIKIGGLLPISGPGSYFGVQDKQGVELALDQLNKPGVNGDKFEVQYE